MDKPFLYLFISSRIRKSSKTDIITKKFLKEKIARILIRSNGLPRFVIKYIIEDLVKYGILTKVNKTNLYRLNKINEEKRVSMLIYWFLLKQNIYIPI